MSDKREFWVRVYMISDSLGIEQTAVNRIINRYIYECREDLLNGNEVRIPGLVSLVPSPICSEYISTIALYASRVSKELGYSYHTCLSVIKWYLKTSKEDLLSGRPIDIRSMVTLHPILEDNVLVKVHSSISTSIKSDLSVKNGDVTSVRAHTCKILKYDIAKSGISDKEAVG